MIINRSGVRLMAEYINKAELIAELKKDAQYDLEALYTIEDMPTIDIVTCKDCKWHEKDGYCPRLWAGSTDDFFCGYGERRD